MQTIETKKYFKERRKKVIFLTKMSKSKAANGTRIKRIERINTDFILSRWRGFNCVCPADKTDWADFHGFCFISLARICNPCQISQKSTDCKSAL